MLLGDLPAVHSSLAPEVWQMKVYYSDQWAMLLPVTTKGDNKVKY